MNPSSGRPTCPVWRPNLCDYPDWPSDRWVHVVPRLVDFDRHDLQADLRICQDAAILASRRIVGCIRATTLGLQYVDETVLLRARWSASFRATARSQLALPSARSHRIR